MITLFASMVISLIAAVTDIRSRRIPNWLTYSAMLLGVGYHTMVSGAQGFFFGAGGLFLGLALLIVFYLMGGMGAGDVKLMGAVGALLGPKGVFIAFIFTALVGGIYAIILLLLRFRVSGTVIRLSTMFRFVAVRHKPYRRACRHEWKNHRSQLRCRYSNRGSPLHYMETLRIKTG